MTVSCKALPRTRLGLERGSEEGVFIREWQKNDLKVKSWVQADGPMFCLRQFSLEISRQLIHTAHLLQTKVQSFIYISI